MKFIAAMPIARENTLVIVAFYTFLESLSEHLLIYENEFATIPRKTSKFLENSTRCVEMRSHARIQRSVFCAYVFFCVKIPDLITFCA